MQSLSREGSALLPYMLRIYKRKNSFPFLSLLPSVSSMGRGKKNRAYEYVYRDVTNRRGKFFSLSQPMKIERKPVEFFFEILCLPLTENEGRVRVRSIVRSCTNSFIIIPIFFRDHRIVYTRLNEISLFSRSTFIRSATRTEFSNLRFQVSRG